METVDLNNTFSDTEAMVRCCKILITCVLDNIVTTKHPAGFEYNSY